MVILVKLKGKHPHNSISVQNTVSHVSDTSTLPFRHGISAMSATAMVVAAGARVFGIIISYKSKVHEALGSRQQSDQRSMQHFQSANFSTIGTFSVPCST